MCAGSWDWPRGGSVSCPCMATLTVEYLARRDLEVAKTTRKRSDLSALENVRDGARQVLADVQGIVVSDGEPGQLLVRVPDLRVSEAQRELQLRIRLMVPPGTLLPSVSYDHPYVGEHI